jgi:type IV pilus assembly protein PilA
MQWYYVNQQQERVGPCDASVLINQFYQGQITMASLVWREGMQEWVPLSTKAQEIGIQHPVDQVVVPQKVAANALRKKGNGPLWLLVIGGLAITCVPILGILIAIALPAYQDYTVRAKVMGAISEASAYKMIVSEHQIANDACLSDEDEAAANAINPSAAISDVSFGSIDSGNCAFEITLSEQVHPDVAGSKILFEMSNDGYDWVCSSTDIKPSNLPQDCR